MKLLPENPTQYDYLHAIRAVAARASSSQLADQIFKLADAGMFAAEKPDRNLNRAVKALECIAEFAEAEGSPFALSVEKTARNALSPERLNLGIRSEGECRNTNTL